MVKKGKGGKRKLRCSSWPRQVGQNLEHLLEKMGGCRVRAGLSALWNCWPQAMGEDLGQLARPLGHKGDTLFVGAEDALEMQEINMQSCEILERANAFLQCHHFRHLRVCLANSPKAGHIPNPPCAPVKALRPRLEQSRAEGAFLREMDMNSPVARCYARFVMAKQKG